MIFFDRLIFSSTVTMEPFTLAFGCNQCINSFVSQIEIYWKFIRCKSVSEFKLDNMGADTSKMRSQKVRFYEHCYKI